MTPELEAARKLFVDERVAEMSGALLQAAKHFASGVNTPGDARGLAGSLRHVGITATEIREGLLDVIFSYQPGWQWTPGGNLQRLFVDSGAFGEVEFGSEGPKVVRELRDVDWDRIFVLYLACVRVYGVKHAYPVDTQRTRS